MNKEYEKLFLGTSLPRPLLLQSKSHHVQSSYSVKKSLGVILHFLIRWYTSSCWISTPLDNFHQDLLENMLSHRYCSLCLPLLQLYIWVEEWLPIAEQLLDCWTLCGFSVEATLHNSLQTSWNRHTTNSSIRVRDLNRRVDNCHTTVPLILNMSERWFAVSHLIENNTKRPDITRLSNLHQFGHTARTSSSSLICICVLQGFR